MKESVNIMGKFNNNIILIKSLLKNRQIMRVKPSVNWFLIKYMHKFTLVNVGGKLFIHSHLPAINSPAFTRFINEHLLAESVGPSHAQIALTNECPQKCPYCYNKNRTGEPLDSETIKRTILELKQMGVVWLGLTGGEPLLKTDLAEIVKTAGPDCAVKLFTTGCTLTEQVALNLKSAGIHSVSVSIDHWNEKIHDLARGYKGAFQAALNAIEILKKVGGIHISVSSVLTKDMIRPENLEVFIQFLMGLGIHEIWLSELKPTTEVFRKKEFVITEDERKNIVKLQDRYNRQGKITINYLGHFEGKEHFGCNAGTKMIYIDAFGEVSPCVFLPMTFGNIKQDSVKSIYIEMKKSFQSQDCCFINKNYELFGKYANDKRLLNKDDSLVMLKEVQFGPFSEFSRLYYGKKKINDVSEKKEN